ncbi:MAG TPA: hypothetical protein VFG07_02760 [Thermoplasmata archaeon]|nr:hypothetical protein [Thermoplasmata archaeon]
MSMLAKEPLESEPLPGGTPCRKTVVAEGPMVQEVFVDPRYPGSTEVKQANPQVPIESAGKELVEFARLEKHRQPDEQVGVLEVRIAHEKVLHPQLRRDCLGPARSFTALVSYDPGNNEVRIFLECLGKALLEVTGLPRVVIVQECDVGPFGR